METAAFNAILLEPATAMPELRLSGAQCHYRLSCARGTDLLGISCCTNLWATRSLPSGYLPNLFAATRVCTWS
eukprot:3160767-Amphidinium_carterae.3